VSLSLEFLDRCASESGFRVAALEKVGRLGELAGDIMRHPFLGKALALKGGSAINLCFGPPKRLSVFRFRDWSHVNSGSLENWTALLYGWLDGMS
jgi:hypothetical protein